VDVTLPAPGTYTVVVHGWETDGPDASYGLYSWNVPLETGGTLNVTSSPFSASTGTTADVTVAWSDLEPEIRHLGAVSHTGPDGLLGLTLVSVDTGAPSAASTPQRPRPHPPLVLPDTEL
jgi:hypothetical protein